MAQIPHELIGQVQISTRAAAGLPDYNPSDPSLPALPSLAAAIAASDPSPPQHLRCRNCKGALLRGSQSIVCVYCGLGPHYDAVPEPINFTSTIGYQWLIRSLRLDGSEMVDPTNKSEQDQMQQRSPKALTPLSEFLNLKIPWPVETEKEANSSSGKHPEESKRSVTLSGVAPDKFFSNLKKDFVSDMSSELPIKHNLSGTADRKDLAAFDHQNLFQNVQSSEPADSSSKHKTSEAFSGWEADFQSADFENQHSADKSSEHFAGSSADTGNNLQDPVSFDRSISLEVDLAAQIDSVFGPVKDLTDEKPKDTPAFDDWNSDDMWNTLSSNNPQFSGGFDSTVSAKNDQEGDRTLEYSHDVLTSDDLFQDFQSPTDYPDMTEHKTKNEEHKTMDENLFEDWNDFTGPTSSQAPFENACIEGGYQVSTSDQKSSEIDLFSLENEFVVDFGSSSQPNLLSSSTSYSNAVTEATATMAENPASNWLSDTISPSHEPGKDANNGDSLAKDDITMLISQMHDLSFMLETDLCIPSESDAHNPSPKD